MQYVKAAEMNFIPALLRLARAYMPASCPAARLWGKGGQVSFILRPPALSVWGRSCIASESLLETSLNRGVIDNS